MSRPRVVLVIAVAVLVFALDRVKVRGERAIVDNSFGPEELDAGVEPELAALSGVGD